MKKLLSICLLSMLMLFAAFSASAQATTKCCFWLENMQPDQVTDVANIPGGGPAATVGNGGSMYLNNSLNWVGGPSTYGVNTAAYGIVSSTAYPFSATEGQTDWYRIHFTNNCNLPEGTQVALEWKLYRDGQRIPDDQISQYADIYFYTKFDELSNTNNVNSTCGHIGWLGGRVYGPGVCQDLHNDCVGGYPGAAEVDGSEQLPYAAFGWSAQGYVNLAASYHYDYFNLPFFSTTEHRMAIHWKQIGNYSVVVGLRARTGGTDFDIAQVGNIGGHQSCCGDLLAQDSLHYPVLTEHYHGVCENAPHTLYGQPEADFSVEGDYRVVFGYDDCGHFVLNNLDYYHYRVRINPDIVGTDLSLCKNEAFTQAQMLALAPAVNTNAPGITGYQVYWCKVGTTNWTTNPTVQSTAVPGTYKWAVKQVNNYDSETGETFDCEGDIDTLTITILPVIDPSLDGTNPSYEFCNETIDANSSLLIKAKLNNTAENDCADEIHWFRGTTHNGTPAFVGAGYTLNLHDLYDNNNNKDVTFTAWSYDVHTNTYSDNGVSVNLHFYATPELTANATTESFVKCPHTPGIELKSNFAVTNGSKVNPVTWAYSWKKNNVAMTATTNNITVVAPGCDQTDTYVVTATVTSNHGCVATITRTFTVKGEDLAAPSIAWRNAATANVTIHGCDTTSAEWTAPYTMSDVAYATGTSVIKATDGCSNVDRIYYYAEIVSSTPCTTVVRRNYYVKDECGNQSNTISQTVTIINNALPVVTPSVLDVTVSNTQDTAIHNDPFNNWYRYSWNQDIFTASEIGGAGVINSVSYNCVNVGTGVNMTDVRIYVAETTNDLHTSNTQWIPADQLTLVYEGSRNIRQTGEIKFDFNQPYLYDGTKNLVVVVAKKTANYNSAVRFAATHLAKASLYRVSDSYDTYANHPGTTTGTYGVNRANARFVISNPVTVAPVWSNTNDCTLDAPAYSVFKTAFDANYNVSTSCNAEVEHVYFYNHGTQVSAANFHNLFATNDDFYVDAVVVDQCGNTTTVPSAFVLHRPERMSIDHNAYAVPTEICLNETSMLHFDYTKVNNAQLPYTFSWTGDPNNGHILRNHDADGAEAIPYLPNTDYRYYITVTDAYGCQAVDSTGLVHVNGLPAAYITENPINDDYAHAGTIPTVCPNFGNFLVEAVAVNGLGDATPVSYKWTGESCDTNSTNQYSSIHVIPTECNRDYTIRLHVTNVKGCSVDTLYTIHAEDTQAPVITGVITSEVLPVSTGSSCETYVPDYTTLLNNTNTSDNCWSFGTLQITQSPVPGTVVDADSMVVSLYVEDVCGNQAIHNIMVRRPGNLLQVALTTDNNNFCYGETAHITSTVANNVGTVVYTWTPAFGNVAAIDYTPAIVNVDSMIYPVTVNVLDQANGCTASSTLNLVVYHVPTAADVNITTTPNNYCDNASNISNGTISVSVLQNNITEYKLSTDATWHPIDYVYTGLHQGTYYIDLKTAHGCVEYGFRTNVLFDTLPDTFTLLTSANSYCTAPFDGTITVENGKANYSYSLERTAYTPLRVINPTTAGPVLFDELENGLYTMHITTDKFCVYEMRDIEVADARVFPVLAAADYTTTPRTICGNNNGTITINNINPDYTYTLGAVSFDGATASTISFVGLAAGTQNLTITTNKGCSMTFGLIVDDATEAPVAPRTNIVANTNCTGTPNGSITVIAPIMGYTYTIGTETIVYDGTNAVVFNNLAAGTYTMTVISDLNCDNVFVFEVTNNFTNPQIPASSINITHRTDCINPNGAITLSAVGLEPSFTYDVVSATGVNANTGLAEGTYTITKTYVATGCSSTATATVEMVAPAYRMNITATPDEDCSTIGTGSLTVTNSDAADYTFILNHGSADAVTAAANTFTGLEPGTYTIRAINNATHCYTDKTVEVGNHYTMPALTVVSTSANNNCSENKDGRVVVATTNITSGMTYTLGSVTNTTGFFTNLNSGNYTIEAISALHCAATINVTVADNAFIPCLAVTTNPNTACIETPSKPGNGQIIVNCPRGDQYDYSFYYANTGSTTDEAIPHFEPIAYMKYTLHDGDYRVHITDQITGCVKDTIVHVDFAPATLNITTSAVANTACAAPYNGTLTVNAAYGVYSLDADAVFTYSIDNGLHFTLDNVFTGLNAGNYDVIVKDTVTGCTYNLAAANVPAGSNDITIIQPRDTVFCLHSEAILTAAAISTIPGDTNFIYTWNSICQGQYVGNPYRWNTNNPDTCDVYLTATSTLTGCSESIIFKVMVKADPTVKFFADGIETGHEFAACGNTFPHTISATGADVVSHSWSNGVTEASFVLDTMAEGYTCMFVDNFVDKYGCASSDSIRVRSLPRPRTTVEMNLCASTPVDTLGTTLTYIAGDDANNNQTIVRTYANAAVNGCDSIVTYNVHLMAKPEVTINADFTTEYCAGNALAPAPVMNINWNNNTGSYRWMNGTTLVSNASINALPFSLDGADLYVIAQNACGTTESAHNTIKVNDKPAVADLASALTVCVGDCIVDKIGGAPATTCNHHNGCTSKWMLNGVEMAATTRATNDMNGAQITYVVTNDCGSTTVGPLTLTVKDSAMLAFTTPAVDTLCDGNTLTINVTTKATNVFTATADNDNFTINTTGSNGNYVVKLTPRSIATAGATTFTFTSASDCGSKDRTFAIVAAYPANVGNVEAIAPVCYNDVLSLTTPSVQNNNSAIYAEGWEINMPGTTTWTSFDPATHMTMAHNGASIRYFVTTRCQTSYSPARTVVVDTLPVATLTNSVAEYCAGDVLSASTFTYTQTNATATQGTVTAEFYFNGAAYTNAPLAVTDNGKEAYYMLTNRCGSNASEKVAIVVNDTAIISYNAADLTVKVCSGSSIEIPFTSNKPVVFTPNNFNFEYDATAHKIVSGAITGAACNNFSVVATATDGKCTDKDKSVTLNITVKTAPFVALTVDSICEGYTFASVKHVTIQNQCSDGISSTISLRRVDNSVEAPLADAYVFTAADTNAIITLSASNDCGVSNISAVALVSLPVQVADIATVDTCKGQPLADFVTVPALTVKGNTTVTAQGWQVYNGTEWTNVEDSYVVNADATVRYYATTRCNNYYSAEATIRIHEAPTFNAEIANIEICSNAAVPAQTISVDMHGATPVDTTWTIQRTSDATAQTFTFGQIDLYDVTYNNATITCTVKNTCGEASSTARLIVDTLPVPTITKDTVVCQGGVANLSATAGYASYQWSMDGAEIAGATAATYAYNAPATDGFHTFTVEVVDGNGCKSVTNINGTFDPIADDAVTVEVTNKPRFIFTDADGNVTRHTTATTADPMNVHTWMINNPCYNPDTLVYVEMRYYHNGQLIPEDSITAYITEMTTTQNGAAVQYTTSDAMSWLSGGSTPLSYTNYYYSSAPANGTSVEGTHFPHNNLGLGGATYVYDCLYLHFLGNRPVTETINQFRRPGNYTVQYTLYSVSGAALSEQLYHNVDDNANYRLGGQDALISTYTRTVLAVDSFVYEVSGDALISAASAPVAPELAPVATNTASASMNVYPNPATDNINVNISGITGETTIRIANLAGVTVVAPVTVNIPADAEYIYRTSINGLASGIYFIHVQGENATLSRKLVVTK